MPIDFQQVLEKHLTQFTTLESLDLSSLQNGSELEVLDRVVSYNWCLFRPSAKFVEKLRNLRSRRRQPIFGRDLEEEFRTNPRFFIYGDINCGSLCKSYDYFNNTTMQNQSEEEPDLATDLTLELKDALYYYLPCPCEFKQCIDSPVIRLFEFLPDTWQQPIMNIGVSSQDNNECVEFVNWIPILTDMLPNKSVIAMCCNRDDPNYGSFSILEDLEEGTGTKIITSFSDITQYYSGGDRLDFIRRFFNAM